MSGISIAEPGCSASAHIQRLACEYDLRDDFYTSNALCQDSANPDSACFDDAETDFDDGLDECNEYLDARLELCESLDDATHDPAFGPDFAADFVDPLEIGSTVAPNPWFALVPGNRWLYEGDGESIEVVVTSDTKLIDGITCIVVIDTAMEDDVVVEITNDWYAQDVSGNVWYCGEIAENFEEFDGDETAALSLSTSTAPGKPDGMTRSPVCCCRSIRRLAMSFARSSLRPTRKTSLRSLLSTRPSLRRGSCDGNCLMTRDFTPLEPDVEENKFYVPGIGLIVEIKPGTTERVELVEFEGVGQ